MTSIQVPTQVPAFSPSSSCLFLPFYPPPYKFPMPRCVPPPVRTFFFFYLLVVGSFYISAVVPASLCLPAFLWTHTPPFLFPPLKTLLLIFLPITAKATFLVSRFFSPRADRWTPVRRVRPSPPAGTTFLLPKAKFLFSTATTLNPCF